MTESQEQIQLIQWCRTDPRLQYLFHIPNESVGGRGWLVRNRQMGVKAGVPDLFYPVPLGGYHGLFIEMKADKGRPSNVQKRWLKALNDLGYKAVVCIGWEEARDALIEYLKGDTNVQTGQIWSHHIRSHLLPAPDVFPDVGRREGCGNGDGTVVEYVHGKD